MNPRNDITTLVSSIIEEGKATSHNIRFSRDKDGAPELLSVYDVIAVLCDCSLDDASDRYRKTVREKIPDLSTYKFPGSGQRDTPVAVPSVIVYLVSKLPSKYPRVEMIKTKFAEVITRAIGGDPTLAMEVMATNHAYESGMIEPDHPLQAFRTQAGKELQNKELACDPRVLEMMATMNAAMERIVKSNAETMERIVKSNEDLSAQVADVRNANQQLTVTNTTLATKLTTLIDRMHDISKTRVITPSNAEKHEVFILFNIQSKEYVPKYEYYIMKCYQEYESLRKSELVARFKKVSELRRIVHPNAGALYQVLREHAKELGIKFYYSGMTLVGASITRVLEFIDKVESDRLMVTV